MTMFETVFGRRPVREVQVPGRVNLLGEWVDFSGGLVLPMAIPMQVELAVGPNQEGMDVIASAQFDGTARFALNAQAEGHWSDYVRGALQQARADGQISGGYNITLHSSIPHGAGLSSSAAVTVASLLAVVPEGATPDLVHIATSARRIENEFIGVPCGIMDQMAVALAKPGDILALETHSLDYEAIALPEGWTISVVHSGVSRELADGRYGQRRDECLDAARQLGVDLLCRADLNEAGALTAPLNRRARHVISEDRRTRDALRALKMSDISRFAQMMNQGHDSIRDEFEITVPEIDALVADALALGALGARQTGGGFGGCVVILTAAQDGDHWWQQLKEKHPLARRVV